MVNKSAEAVIDVEYADGQLPETDIPGPQLIENWARLAMQGQQGECALRIVDSTEMAQLNLDFANKNRPTNVLSFPADQLPGTDLALMGDIAICADIVEQEARQQQKPIEAHWAHMVIHGVLHLRGFDHQSDDEALAMESLEISLLQQLGYQNPYCSENEFGHREAGHE